MLPSLPSLSSPDSGTEATLAKAEAETAQAREEAQQAAEARNRVEMTALADVQAEAAKMQASAAFAAKRSLVESSMRGKLSLETDEALLREEDRAIRALDSKIKGERKVEKVEKAQLKKKNDALLAAVKAGDMSAISLLKTEILQLEADFDKEERILAALVAEEKVEQAIEDKQMAKVNAERAEEAAKEGDAIAADADSSAAM